MSAVRSKVSVLGMNLGAIAFLLALVHFWAGPFAAPKTVGQAVEEAAQDIKNATISALSGEEQRASRWSRMNIDDVIKLAVSVLGGLAFVIGVFGLARQTAQSQSIGALILGGGALAFQLVPMIQ